MIVSLDDSFIYAIAGVAVIGCIIATVEFMLIRMGGPVSMAFIKAGWQKGSRILMSFGTDQSCIAIVGRAAGDGVVDETHSTVNGAYITPKGSFYLAGKHLIAPVYSPFGIAWNMEVIAFLDWVRSRFGKERMNDVLEDVGIWEKEELMDQQAQPVLDPTTGQPIIRRVLKGINNTKMESYKYNVEKEWELVCKKHHKYISGRAVTMETAMGWVTRNINPNFFKSMVALGKARIINKMQKNDNTKYVLIGVMLLFGCIGIGIMWVMTGGFGGNHNTTTIVQDTAQHLANSTIPKIVK